MRYGTTSEYDAMLKSFDDKDAKKAAIALFKLNKGDAVSLEIWIPDEMGVCFDTKIIHPSQWPLIILRTAQNNPQFEVSVKTPRYKIKVPSLCTLLGYFLLVYIVIAVLELVGTLVVGVRQSPQPSPPPPNSFWGL